MQYISTRGKAPVLNFEQVVMTGLAADGGLYVPETIPTFSREEIASWAGLTYQELAEKVMAPFVEGSIPRDDLRALIAKSYATFRHEEVTPLHRLDDATHVLELFHGPTLAFKDVALQFLGNLFDYFLEKQKRDIVIVGATSGDTGSAAIEGCRHCKHIKLFMLHPFGRVSDVQRRQMTTIQADTIHNLAVESDFDDCQAMVKAMFAHPEFLRGVPLTAVNSINWARIMAQIVYYFYAALKLGAPETAVSFTVPTGNFGDIYAGYMAHRMGLPVGKLVVATNSNDILHRFFTANDYRKNGVEPTLSPSMDIQISSNFERLLFDLHQRNGEAVEQLMAQFGYTGGLQVSDEVLEEARRLFCSHATHDEDIKATVSATYAHYGYMIDPHTATGIAAAGEYPDDTPMVVLATAHPAKFPEVVEEVLGIHPPLPDHLQDLMKRQEYYTQLPNDIEAVKAFISEKL